jgi:hypothetical protein
MKFQFFSIFNEVILSETFRINFFLHVLIMLTFLSVFFYIFLSKELDMVFNSKLDDQIKNFPKLLPPQYNLNNNINNLNLNMTGKFLIKETLDNYKKRYDAPDVKAKIMNNSLIRNLFLVVGVLWVLFVIYIIVVKFLLNHQINIFHIILENLVTFAIIGYAEYYFFMNYALNYPPCTENYISTQMINVLKAKATQ